jgi:hypothetical protein
VQDIFFFLHCYIALVAIGKKFTLHQLNKSVTNFFGDSKKRKLGDAASNNEIEAPSKRIRFAQSSESESDT